MSLPHRIVLVMLLMTVPASRLFALGGKHPATQPLGNVHGDWSAALLTAVNSPERVAGQWVNANDELFYRGDNTVFGKFLHRVADTKLPLTLVLHTAPQRRSLLWGEEPRVPYDWTLLVGAAGWVSPEWKLNFGDSKAKYALRVDLWVGSDVTVDMADLPAGVRLSVEGAPVNTTQPSGREVAR